MKSVVVGFRLKEDIHWQLVKMAASASMAIGDLCRRAVLELAAAKMKSPGGRPGL